jgi:hypothetical protein
MRIAQKLTKGCVKTPQKKSLPYYLLEIAQLTERFKHKSKQKTSFLYGTPIPKPTTPHHNTTISILYTRLTDVSS